MSGVDDVVVAEPGPRHRDGGGSTRQVAELAMKLLRSAVGAVRDDRHAAGHEVGVERPFERLAGAVAIEIGAGRRGIGVALCQPQKRVIGLGKRPGHGLRPSASRMLHRISQHGLSRCRVAGRPYRYIRCDSGSCSRQPSAKHASPTLRSEEHTSELQSLMRISYAVFCLKKKKKKKKVITAQMN